MKQGSQILKRVLSMIVVLTMVFAMLPTTVFAANSVSGGILYFDNSVTGWDDNYIYFVIGHNSWSSLYQMSKVDDAGNLYSVTIPNWDGSTYYAVIGTNSSWGSGSWGPSNLKNANHYTAAYTSNYGLNSGNHYVLTPGGAANGSAMTIGWYGTTPYAVGVADCANGKVTASKTVAESGNTINLTVTPDEGYELNSLSVKQGTNDVPVNNGAFTMPAGNVTITASFTCKHASHDTDGKCATCGETVSHGWNEGVCDICGVECAHESYMDGLCAECGMEAPSEEVKLYLKPNSNWLEANARFAAYFFGNGEIWVSMTDVDFDGIYEVVAPEGYPKVIFCRMNPSSTANNWDNKWNQTGDLTIPTDGKNLFTLSDGIQDGATTTWSVFTPSATAATLTVAGSSGLCGSEWDPADTANDMVKKADGTYEKVYTNVAAGTYSFKVVLNHAWGREWPSSDYSLTVDTDGSTVTILFDPAAQTVNAVVTVPTPEPEPEPEPEPTTDYYLVGFINGADYNGEDYKFVDGQLTVTFTNDSYVVVKDGSGDWYLCESYCTGTSAVLTKGHSEKMFIAAGTEWTFTLVENGDGTLTLSYAQKEVGGGEGGEEGDPCTVTLHFANTAGWSAVGLYVWDDTDATPLGGWPGTALSQDADGFYSCSFEVPYGATVNFIFNNNLSDGASQTVDLTLGAVTSNVEKWVKLTTQTEGKYNADILSEAFRIVQSPVVEGTSVTFYYQGGDDVVVYGSWDGWAQPVTMTKDADGVWSATVTMPSYGTYEYKFVADGSWITDPANSWIQNDNSAFVILNPNAEDKNEVTVNIHYSRADGNYEGWNLWMWNANMDGKQYDFVEVNGEMVVSITFENARSVLSLSLIPRFSTADNKWASQEATHVIDLSDVVSGTVDYYVASSTRAFGDDVVLGTKLKDVELDYDSGKIHISVANPVTDPDFALVEGDDPDTYTIYFQNNWLWDDVCIYYWDATGENAAWPGVAMTKVGNDGTYDIYMARIPVDATGMIINGVKNDGSGSRDQTPDITGGFADGLCYYMTWNNGNQVGSFAYEGHLSYTDIPVAEMTGSGTDYVMTPGITLDLVNLYRYKILFEGYEYVIDFNAAYASDKFAEEFTYTGTDLGANWNENYTYFCVWAPTAERVYVNLYASGTAGTDDLIKTVEMTKGEKGTWYTTVNEDLNGTYYTYSVKVNGEVIEAVDPYARTTGVNGQRGMVIDLDSTDPAGWAADKNPNPSTSYTDAIIYELHVRDFSIDASSGIVEDYMGKFLAFTQTGTTVNGQPGGLSTGIDYLKDLGVTHVHLLPVYDYGSVDETTCSNFNLGYDPVNYNVPEGSYSTDPYKGEVRVEEFKLMVQALHNAGISVIMDVVYNHVYDAGEFGFNQIVPGYFSRPSSNASGCGNDTASEREMVRKYIVESVAFWSSEYHIDGFRFDLVGLIDVETINQIVDTVHATRPDTIFYGEGWDMDGTNKEPGTEMAKQGNASKVPGFAFFSDSVRNGLAGNNGNSTGFVSGAGNGSTMIAEWLGNPWWTNNPSQVVQYASCHDNYTLIDKLILSTGAPGITDDIISMNNLAAVFYMTSQGIPFIHAGEEMLREKLEEDGGRCENSYNATDYVNSIKWDNLLTEEYADTVEYYKGLIAFRKEHDALRMNNADDVADYIQAVKISNNVIAFFIDGNGAKDDDILVIFNAGTASTVVQLPEGIWNVCVDDEDAGTETLYTAQTAVQIKGISAMILTQKDAGKGSVETGSGSASGDTITLYFSNNKYWGSVYAYYWGGSYGPAWPGETMTWVEKNDYGEDIYSITIPADSTGLIFNNNSGSQTVDLIPGVDGTGYYLSDDSGNCGTYTYTASSGGGSGSSFVNDGVYEGTSQYYLFGYINGEDYAAETYAAAMGKYQFVNGKLTVTFEEDSYVGVKTTGNGTWYMTDGWLGSVTSATLYNSNNLGSDANKLIVPGGVEVTFTLTVNSDGTLTLRYVAEDVSVSDETGIQSGATLHCWNWSFAAIEANMALIDEMGFTAIQTSPVQPVKQNTDGSPFADWWVYYQPVDFIINNVDGNALGTKAELESMIATAHKYGIQVIVDVVANHLANNTGNDLFEQLPHQWRETSYWHNIAINTTNYSDRYDVTQHCMAGLPDLHTGNSDVQQYVLNFLKECIDLGVDGFRFDGAKHIETPDDELYFESEFWPTVIGGARAYASEMGKAIYVYGEVLDGTNGYAISDYTKFMSVTDNSWGNTLREIIANGSASISAGYDKAADASDLVIWAESHDTYADGTSSGISVENINKVWALIAARSGAMGLYFARPESMTQDLGVASVTGWYSPAVAAANRFHLAFAGKSETVGSSGNIAYVVRGDSGIVLVNAGGMTAAVSAKVPMADGAYLDQLSGNIFTVTDGVITGNIGETGIAVVYNTELSVTVTQPQGGEVSVDRETALYGETVTITVKPDTGKAIADVVVVDADGNPVAVTDNGDGTYTFLQPIKDATVTVIFEDIFYNVQVSPTLGGQVGISNAAPIYGEIVTITVTPDIGMVIYGVSVTNKLGQTVEITDNGDGTYSFQQPAEDVTVTVDFQNIVYNATVTAPVGGEVSISNTTPIYGEIVTITAMPEIGKQVLAVLVNDGAVEVTDNGDGTYSFLQPAGDVTVTVTFENIVYRVDVTEPNGGSVSVDHDHPIYGEIVTITVTPDIGKQILAVLVNDGAVAVTDNGDGTYSFQQPAGDVTVTVTFESIIYNATVTEPVGGEVSISNTAPIYGEIVTITAMPEIGKQVLAVLVNDGAVEVTDNGDGTYSFLQPAGDVTITVTFGYVDYKVTLKEHYGGDTTVDCQTAIYGQTVTVTMNAHTGMVALLVKVTTADGQEIRTRYQGNDVYTFQQPASDVTVTVIYAYLTYDVTVSQNEGGQVVVDNSMIFYDDAVTFSVLPEEGMQLVSLNVKDANGDPVDFVDNGDGTYSFRQPDCDVEIIVSFAPEGQLLGDANGDGKVDTTDAKLIMQLDLGLIGEDAVNLAVLDVNGDGKVDTTDAKLIMQLDLGLITEFPKP